MAVTRHKPIALRIGLKMIDCLNEWNSCFLSQYCTDTCTKFWMY